MQAPNTATSFNLNDLQHLVSLGYGADAARPLLWSLAPFEYLARRRNPQKQLVVDEVPVAELIPHIPWMLQFCRSLIDSSSSPATAHEAARKASTFTARLLEVLSIPAVQDRMGGRQQLQPSLDLLREALPAFRQRAAAGQQLQPPLPQSSPSGRTETSALLAPAPAGGSGGSAAAATAAAAAAAQGSRFESCQGAAVAAIAAAAGPPAATTATDAAAPVQQPPVSTASMPAKSTRKGMHLAALLKAIDPFTRQPGSPFPPDFGLLLKQWARLVYGELAETRSVQVAALMLYHWRTLLRFLRLCLQGVASLSSGCSSGSSSSGPMLVSTATSLIQALLHLLHNEPIRALFMPQQYRRVTDHLVAIKTLLASLPQTPAGHAAAVDRFCSAAVAALMDAGTAQLPPLPPPPKPDASVRSSAGRSSELSESQHQLLNVVKSQLQQAWVLNPAHLDAVQEVLDILRRQVAEGSGGSDRMEITLLPP